MLLFCTYELSNYISYQVEMVRAGSITTVAQHSGVSLLLQLFCRVASLRHDFCANNGTSPVTCLKWRESWPCAQLLTPRNDLTLVVIATSIGAC